MVTPGRNPRCRGTLTAAPFAQSRNASSTAASAASMVSNSRTCVSDRTMAMIAGRPERSGVAGGSCVGAHGIRELARRPELLHAQHHVANPLHALTREITTGQTIELLRQLLVGEW